MGLRNILLGIFLGAGVLLRAQLLFNQLPASLQFFPRDSAGFGRFTVSGKNNSAAAVQLKSRLVDSLSTAPVVEEKAITVGAGQEFHIKHLIPARIAEFRLMIYMNKGKADSLLKTVSRLVCGDCFMIGGQSNALAAAEPGDSTYMRPWLRGIGTNDNAAVATFPCEPQITSFAPANPGWAQQGFVGTWGMKLTYEVARYAGMPLCMINWSRAASSIRQNFASHTPSDIQHLDSCNGYDRGYLKVTRNHLNNYVRAMFWYQGETDSNMPSDSVCSYFDRFHTLYTSWKLDYPKIEKIFLLQINTGCNETNLSQFREIQRQLSYKYPDIVLMSTFSTDTADRTSDYCHYSPQGYRRLADRLVPLVKKHIYKEDLSDEDIMPPNIVKAYASGPSELCLEFDKAVTVQQEKHYGRGTAYMKDYFYGEGFSALRVQSVSSNANRILLQFNRGDTLPDKISYTPQSFSKIPSFYTGPWILNAKNATLPAISFYDFPVTSDDPGNNWSAESITGACGHYVPFVDKGFSVFPNPAQNELTLRFPANQKHDNTVTLMDAQGKIVIRASCDNAAFVRLDVSGFEKGIYLLKVSNANSVFIKKVLLE